MKTFSQKPADVQKEWIVIDADGVVPGRLASFVASRLRGKHKPTFTPHVDDGDHVIIVNADKVVLTSGKADREMIYRHSGYPGGLKSETFAQLHARKPAEAVRRSVKGMLPKGPLGRQQMTKLKVYAGPDHPHQSQSPKKMTVPGAAAR